MKAPDKIYLFFSSDGDYLAFKEKPFEGTVAYIRKDALLEWLKEMKRICRGAEPIEKAYQTIIDKLNSM